MASLETDLTAKLVSHRSKADFGARSSSMKVGSDPARRSSAWLAARLIRRRIFAD